MPNRVRPGQTFVLIHGAYHGGWCWDRVADLLRDERHRVLAPTLTGLGERAHLASVRPTLETFIQDIASIISFNDLREVILVGHSFGGAVMSGVVDRLPQRIAATIYLDALVLASGEAPFDRLPPEVVRRHTKLAGETSDGLTVPPPEPEYFGLVVPEQIRWLAKRLTAQPLAPYESVLTLSHPAVERIPAAYISCIKPRFAGATASFERAMKRPNWRCEEILACHDVMVAEPELLSTVLMRLARELAPHSVLPCPAPVRK